MKDDTNEIRNAEREYKEASAPSGVTDGYGRFYGDYFE